MGCVWAALRAGFVVFILMLFFELEPFGWFDGLSPQHNFVAFLALSALFAILLELARLVLPRTWDRFAIAAVGALVAALPTAIAVGWLESRYGASSPSAMSALGGYFTLLPFVLPAAICVGVVEFDLARKPGRRRKRLRLVHLLTGAEYAGLLAMTSEQGKVRAFTDRGERLIDTRLIDVMTDVREADGLKVHRDWWVARRAVTGFERRGGKVFLTLVNGRSAPVGPAFAKAVRSAGLID